MAFIQNLSGCYAHWKDVDLFFRAGGSTSVPVEVWGFTDGLVVAPTSTLRFLTSRWSTPESATVEEVVAANPGAVCLDRSRVDRIELGPKGTHRWAVRLGVDHAVFHRADLSTFDLMVSRRHSDEALALLRQIFPGKARDHRKFG